MKWFSDMESTDKLALGGLVLLCLVVIVGVICETIIKVHTSTQ